MLLFKKRIKLKSDCKNTYIKILLLQIEINTHRSTHLHSRTHHNTREAEVDEVRAVKTVNEHLECHGLLLRVSPWSKDFWKTKRATIWDLGRATN